MADREEAILGGKGRIRQLRKVQPERWTAPKRKLFTG
jgi:hypothetical protein